MPGLILYTHYIFVIILVQCCQSYYRYVKDYQSPEQRITGSAWIESGKASWRRWPGKQWWERQYRVLYRRRMHGKKKKKRRMHGSIKHPAVVKCLCFPPHLKWYGDHAGTLIRNFQPPELWEVEVCHWSHSAYGILSLQLEGRHAMTLLWRYKEFSEDGLLSFRGVKSASRHVWHLLME